MGGYSTSYSGVQNAVNLRVANGNTGVFSPALNLTEGDSSSTYSVASLASVATPFLYIARTSYSVGNKFSGKLSLTVNGTRYI